MRIGVDARNLVPELSGIGRYVFEMCRQLAEAGHSLFLYLPEEPSADFVLPAGATARVSRAAGPARRALWSQTALPRQANRDRLDAFWGPSHRLPPFLAGETGRVVTIHDLVWLHAPATMLRRGRVAETLLMPRALRAADRVAAVSNATAEALALAFPASRRKLQIVYPGLTPLPDPDGKALHAAGIDRPYVLFVGTLEPRKNLLKLLEAFSRLPGELRAANLLVIAGGRGWGLPDLRQVLAGMGLSRDARLIGRVSDAALAALYAGARFLAMPSLLEGFGIPIIEANAAGTPVLVSNTSSMPEAAGQAGLFVDPSSTDAIRQGLLRLLCDEPLRSALAAQARRNAARFSWRESADALLRLLAEAANARRRP